MEKKILGNIICSFCGSDLVIKKELEGNKNSIMWGLLFCSECEESFPIVAGIPIIMAANRRINLFAQSVKQGFHKEGDTVGEICEYLSRGDIESVNHSLNFFNTNQA